MLQIFIKMKQRNLNYIISGVLILFAAILKVATFPNSFNPIIAISLFSGVIIKDKKFAFAIPLLAMFTSDIMLEVFNITSGFYGMSQVGNYASLLFITVLGFTMKKSSIVHIGGYTILSSIIFFFLSNTNCFFFDNANYYGSGISGWTNCLIAGIPFVKNGMITDLFFSAVLFGSYILFVKSNQKRIIAG